MEKIKSIHQTYEITCINLTSKPLHLHRPMKYIWIVKNRQIDKCTMVNRIQKYMEPFKTPIRPIRMINAKTPNVIGARAFISG